MNRRTVTVLGMILLAAAVFVAIVERPNAEGGDTTVDGPTVRGGTGDTGDKARRERSASGKKLPPMDRLNQLVRADIEHPPEFGEFEDLVSRLSDDELEQLREATAEARADTLTAWLRCAVYAELGRRDPQAIMERLATSSEFWTMPDWTLRQVWVSTFRGWAERDPAATAEAMQTYQGPQERTGRVLAPDEIDNPEDYARRIENDDVWQRQAFQEIFAAWAASDSEAAWEALPELGMFGLRSSALEGMVRGANAEDLEALLARARDTSMQTALGQVRPWTVGVRVTNPDQRSDWNSIVGQAALRMAEEDLAGAVTWLDSVDEQQEPMSGPRMSFLWQLAVQRPDDVVSLLETDTFLQPTAVGHLAAAHPERAVEFIPHLDPEHAIYLGVAIVAQSRLRMEDLFPAPDRPNRLPNYGQRYHGLLEAIEQSGAEADMRQDLLNQLNQEFAEVLPGLATPANP